MKGDSIIQLRVYVTKKRGVSLAEILMALLILALAVLPAVGSFSTYYGTATRQMEQEIALKLGEAVINVLMTVNYPDLVLGNITDVPIMVQLPAGELAANISFDGNVGTGSAIAIGRANFDISTSVTRAFEGQSIMAPHFDAMELKYFAPLPGPGGVPPGKIATYSCFDDLLTINVVVNYGGANPITLSTFRADLTR